MAVQNLEMKLKLPNINVYILDEFIIILVSYFVQIKEIVSLFKSFYKHTVPINPIKKVNILIKKFMIEKFQVSLIFNDLEKISEKLEAAKKFRLLFSFLESVKYVFFNLQKFSQTVYLLEKLQSARAFGQS